MSINCIAGDDIVGLLHGSRDDRYSGFTGSRYDISLYQFPRFYDYH